LFDASKIVDEKKRRAIRHKKFFIGIIFNDENKFTAIDQFQTHAKRNKTGLRCMVKCKKNHPAMEWLSFISIIQQY